jgi:hypothetical protein
MVADGKIKKEDAQAALAALNESNPTVYKKEFGFIAQEIKELFPELVEKGKDGVYAVNYTGLIPVLVESIKELQKRISELENQVESSSLRTLSSSGTDTGNETANIAEGAVLHQNIPNPFHTETTIAYELPEKYSSANLYIYSSSGAQVKNYILNGSANKVTVSAYELAAGTCLYARS